MPTPNNKERNDHDYVESNSNQQYYRCIFCRKCGQVAWFFNRDADWNIKNLQSRLKYTCGDTSLTEIIENPHAHN